MLDRAAVEKILGIGKTRFFALLKQYRHDPSRLCLAYRRETPARISTRVEKEIEKELMVEKDLSMTLPCLLPPTTNQPSGTV
ncbi:MAG: hypothetical protein QME90_04355 [Thermodesulfobacteriota bacterium]|nr:hypothetical protein [Thermodesulfobacteriota bacterium]